MKYGSKEWLKAVDELHDFPLVMAIFLPSNGNALKTQIIETKSKRIGDIKYDKISPDFLMEDGSALALLDVKRIHSAEEYYVWTLEHRKAWRPEKIKRSWN